MLKLTEEQRALVMTEVQKQPYVTCFDPAEIRRALDTSVSLFQSFEQTFVPGFCGVLLHPQGVQRPADFAMELIPGLVYAYRHFGQHLPEGLIRKLRNDSQTHDTLLELTCLGALESTHAMEYEPSLPGGTMPDLLVRLRSGRVVYIECKCQRLVGSTHHRLFTKATERIQRTLGFERSAFVKTAWTKGLRIEVTLSQNPSAHDIRALETTIDHLEASPGRAIATFGSISLDLIPKDELYDESKPAPSGVIRVGTTPTRIHHSNVHLAIYPWSGLDIIRRRSQRRLLAEARRKLRSIPDRAWGLICIQTFSSSKFAPDIHRLVSQPAFSRIPIVWLNPIGRGQVIARNDALSLRDELFGDLLRRSKEDTNNVIDSDEE